MTNRKWLWFKGEYNQRGWQGYRGEAKDDHREAVRLVRKIRVSDMVDQPTLEHMRGAPKVAGTPERNLLAFILDRALRDWCAINKKISSKRARGQKTEFNIKLQEYIEKRDLLRAFFDSETPRYANLAFIAEQLQPKRQKEFKEAVFEAMENPRYNQTLSWFA